jgi:hypothetical protein
MDMMRQLDSDGQLKDTWNVQVNKGRKHLGPECIKTHERLKELAAGSQECRNSDEVLAVRIFNNLAEHKMLNKAIVQEHLRSGLEATSRPGVMSLDKLLSLYSVAVPNREVRRSSMAAAALVLISSAEGLSRGVCAGLLESKEFILDASLFSPGFCTHVLVDLGTPDPEVDVDVALATCYLVTILVIMKYGYVVEDRKDEKVPTVIKINGNPITSAEDLDKGFSTILDYFVKGIVFKGGSHDRYSATIVASDHVSAFSGKRRGGTGEVLQHRLTHDGPKILSGWSEMLMCAVLKSRKSEHKRAKGPLVYDNDSYDMFPHPRSPVRVGLIDFDGWMRSENKVSSFRSRNCFVVGEAGCSDLIGGGRVLGCFVKHASVMKKLNPILKSGRDIKVGSDRFVDEPWACSLDVFRDYVSRRYTHLLGTGTPTDHTTESKVMLSCGLGSRLTAWSKKDVLDVERQPCPAIQCFVKVGTYDSILRGQGLVPNLYCKLHYGRSGIQSRSVHCPLEECATVVKQSRKKVLSATEKPDEPGEDLEMPKNRRGKKTVKDHERGSDVKKERENEALKRKRAKLRAKGEPLPTTFSNLKNKEKPSEPKNVTFASRLRRKIVDSDSSDSDTGDSDSEESADWELNHLPGIPDTLANLKSRFVSNYVRQ